MSVRNLVIMSGDKVLLAHCRGSVYDKHGGELVWDPENNTSDSLFISCSNFKINLTVEYCGD